MEQPALRQESGSQQERSYAYNSQHEDRKSTGLKEEAPCQHFMCFTLDNYMGIVYDCTSSTAACGRRHDTPCGVSVSSLSLGSFQKSVLPQRGPPIYRNSHFGSRCVSKYRIISLMRLHWRLPFPARGADATSPFSEADSMGRRIPDLPKALS